MKIFNNDIEYLALVKVDFVECIVSQIIINIKCQILFTGSDINAHIIGINLN